MRASLVWLVFYAFLLLNVSSQMIDLPGEAPNYRTDSRFASPVDLPVLGSLQGFKVPYEQWYDHRYKQIDQSQRLIQDMHVYLGVPYARPPLTTLRFKPPLDPLPWSKDDPTNIDGRYNATWYRPVCPQDPTYVNKIYKGYMNKVNVSEDCLYMNIWRPDLHDKKTNANYRYPVLVFVHGGEFADFNSGAAQQFPGFVLAQYGVLVVTFNYRLGPLGFLTTSNNYAMGNYGFLDVVKCLEFIQLYIDRFYGDKNRVTVIGYDSGAALVSAMLVSPMTRRGTGNELFHRAVVMGGADTCEWSYITEEYRPYEYATELAIAIGCQWNNQFELIECLYQRNDKDIAKAGRKVKRKWGARSGPWALTVHRSSDVFDDTPRKLRDSGYVMRLPLMSGFTKNAGAPMLFKYQNDFEHNAVDPAVFRKIILNEIVQHQRMHQYETKKLLDAIEFEYTFWSNPNNHTATLENLVAIFSDYYFGTGIDLMMKSQNDGNPTKLPLTYSFIFDYLTMAKRTVHESPTNTISPESLPPDAWKGVYHGQELSYLFGFPMMNETIQKLFYVDVTRTAAGPLGMDDSPLKFQLPEDGNFSDYFIKMVVDFATSVPVEPIPYKPQQPWRVYNFSWYPYNLTRVSTARLFEYPHAVFAWHMSHYGFWSSYFDLLVEWLPLVSTTYRIPTAMYQYQASTFVLAGFLVVTMIAAVALTIALIRVRNKRREDDEAGEELQHFDAVSARNASVYTADVMKQHQQATRMDTISTQQPATYRQPYQPVPDRQPYQPQTIY